MTDAEFFEKMAKIAVQGMVVGEEFLVAIQENSTCDDSVSVAGKAVKHIRSLQNHMMELERKRK